MTYISVQNTFVDALPSDIDTSNTRRQVHNAAYSYTTPKGMQAPQLLIYSPEVAALLSITADDIENPAFAEMMTGTILPANSKPFAMCYGGHQFGNWANQLGDGRAINLGDIPTSRGSLNLQLKGAGPTPYSRTADGLAVLRSSIREFLCSEAMYHLGVPTTRALSLCLTGEEVLRDMMYNGNAAYEPGAVVCRVSESFIRIGSFEIFAARKDLDSLKKLADFTILHHYHHLDQTENKYIKFFQEVCDATSNMIVHWQRVGFVHGVMNTDNMSILGQTIDYGPYGWLDDYDPNWTPNTTDLPGRRYRFGNQPAVAQWNLIKLANALYPLILDEKGLTDILHSFQAQYEERYLSMMKQKLGLYTHGDDDAEWIRQLEGILALTEIDMTIFFRSLSLINQDMSAHEALESLHDCFYQFPLHTDAQTAIVKWLEVYLLRIKIEALPHENRVATMNQVNPKYVLRNYMAQMAIEAAEKKDYSLLHELFEVLKKPYDEQETHQRWFAKRPDWARQKVGCSMLSCSS